MIEAKFKIPNFLISSLFFWAALLAQDSKFSDNENSLWSYSLYMDMGYGYSFNDPQNGLWNYKSTTYKFGEPKINMAMGVIQKQTASDSRWGFEFGLQSGVDTEPLVPSGENVAKANADALRYLHRLNASYLIPIGNGLQITAGLINSFIAYESYLAIDNPNYTRGYLSDNVPYFFFGGQAGYIFDDKIDMSLFVLDGWSYLAKGSGKPSFGWQVNWRKKPGLVLTLNLYYGQEKSDEGEEYSISFFDAIVAWENNHSLFALSFDVGSNNYSSLRSDSWASGAFWGQWKMKSWQFGFRPELFYDRDCAITGDRQKLLALTMTLGYDISSKSHNHLNARLEYRIDNSTESEGGFYKGEDNHLTFRQNTIFLAFLYRFGSN